MNACAVSGIYEEHAVPCVPLCMAYMRRLEAFITQLCCGSMALYQRKLDFVFQVTSHSIADYMLTFLILFFF